MLPTPNELRCIEIARVYRVRNVRRMIAKFDRHHCHFVGFGNYLKLAGVEEGLIAEPARPVGSIILLILIILSYPFAWVILFFSRFNQRKTCRKDRQNLVELLRETKVSSDVSENKSFMQLWSDHGLRDYGLGYLDNGSYSVEEKRSCLSEWIKILYLPDFDLVEFEDIIRKRNREQAKERIRKHPGTHIYLAEPINLVPFKIDQLFGKYELEMVPREFSEN